VAWVVPPDRVLAIRVIDPERSAGPPHGEVQIRPKAELDQADRHIRAARRLVR
jgi:hypothetical protein